MTIRVFIISLILDFSALLFSFHAIPNLIDSCIVLMLLFYIPYTLISDRKLFCLLIFTVIIKRYMRGYSIPFLLIIKLVELILEKKDFNIWSLKKKKIRSIIEFWDLNNFLSGLLYAFFSIIYTANRNLFNSLIAKRTGNPRIISLLKNFVHGLVFSICSLRKS